ncbi:MAG: EAL domain-containing protein [Candidatus Binataceae bacterium]|nr:EAL domain-containing protein [Candidatus Binataceae bacterium]
MSAAIRVLLIEDSPDDVTLMQRQLKREGLEIEYRVETTEEGLRRAIEDFRPQVMLSDFTIPGFSGAEALRLAATIAPSVPFIFVSGTIGEEVAVQCLQSGATDYVLKGNLRRLGSAVRRALREAAERVVARTADETRHRLAQILEATTDLVATKDAKRRLTFLNEAGCRLIGITREEAIGRQAEDLYTSAARRLVREIAVPAADKDGAWEGESALLTQDGVEIPVSQVIVAHRGADGATQFYSTIARDIRERKAHEAQIVHMANTDALTGLPNRLLLGDRVAQAIVHSRRSRRPLAMLSIDLDRFKLVNEGFGHAVGDEVLREIGALLRATVRDGDTVARLGADEFVVLLADLAHAGDTYSVARKLLDAMSRPRRVAGKELRVTASIGAALFPDDGDGFELLLRNAGAAVHRVKAQGGGSFQYYASGMTEEALERIALERGLQVALEQNALTLHFQPLYDLRTRRPTGVETLLRWFGKDGKAVSPARFIPVAEETGLIRPIGEWVLARACRTVLEWKTRGGSPPRVGVNVSPRQLRDGTFPGIVKRVLDETGFPASRLELEITESALMESGDAAVRTMAELKALEVTIAIDDFGTGYSSLSYLSRMPIDRLKVDLAFVHRMTKERQDAAIVQAVVSLGHALGLQVVAEGVETEEQLALLAKMDCDEVQGYLLARPASGEQVRSLFDEESTT